MRKPNGYGAVIKLKGNRRKPYAVRITTGWTDEGKQRIKYLGYYSSSKEAEIALADYNKNPFMILDDITFADLFKRFSEAKFSGLSEKTVHNYTLAYKSCEELYSLPITKINLGVLQRHIDESPKHKPALQVEKTLWGSMFDYAIRNEWLPPERKSIISHVDLSKKGNPNQVARSIFTQEEIDNLWEHSDSFECQCVLILIYTGVRVSELLELTEDNVHLSEQYFEIKSAKTKAGIRTVPIADKILPFMEAFPLGKYDYQQFRKKIFNKVGLYHTPHDTRHTFISLLTEKEVDPRTIKAIVGHAGSGVTEAVYTHIPVRKLLEAVNKLFTT